MDMQMNTGENMNNTIIVSFICSHQKKITEFEFGKNKNFSEYGGENEIQEHE